ncbi:MAG: hypothetical protein ACR2HR_15065 [Euzebya sp.]
MDPQHRPGVALTAFDRRTAQAVVTVLQRAGIDAWTGMDEDEDTPVLVAEGLREQALQVLGQRMEEVRQATAEADRNAARSATTGPSHPPRDPDDVHDGPPLVMERFRSMRVLAVVIMVPLLAVTLAPTIRGVVRVVVFVVLLGLGAVIVVRHRNR